METKVGIIGEKLGMSQFFDKDENLVPVTVIQAYEGTIIQVKTNEKDGYQAIRVAFHEVAAKKLNKPEEGVFKKLKLKPHKIVKEFRLDKIETFKIGDKIMLTQFSEGDIIDVIGVSKGKGFQGVVKRYGFKGGPKTRGQSDRWRAPGAAGSGTSPGHVWKGKKMPGRMGSDRITIQRLRIAGVDKEKGLILIKGAVPGRKNSILVIKESVKKVK
ncbi:MAG: 50S ribosomal protein L3 [bacterium]|nr:50S ribosomal protein L3 [bacterium]